MSNVETLGGRYVETRRKDRLQRFITTVHEDCDFITGATFVDRVLVENMRWFDTSLHEIGINLGLHAIYMLREPDTGEENTSLLLCSNLHNIVLYDKVVTPRNDKQHLPSDPTRDATTELAPWIRWSFRALTAQEKLTWRGIRGLTLQEFTSKAAGDDNMLTTTLGCLDEENDNIRTVAAALTVHYFQLLFEHYQSVYGQYQSSQWCIVRFDIDYDTTKWHVEIIAMGEHGPFYHEVILDFMAIRADTTAFLERVAAWEKEHP